MKILPISTQKMPNKNNNQAFTSYFLKPEQRDILPIFKVKERKLHLLHKVILQMNKENQIGRATYIRAMETLEHATVCIDDKELLQLKSTTNDPETFILSVKYFFDESKNIPQRAYQELSKQLKIIGNNFYSALGLGD